MTPPPSQSWAPRFVAGWCDRRADAKDERKLLKRAHSAYRKGPLVEPVRQFAAVLEAQIVYNAAQWRQLAAELRLQADQMDEAATAHIPPAPIETPTP